MSLTTVDCGPFSLAFLLKTTETGQLGSSLRTFSQIIKTQYTLCIKGNRSRMHHTYVDWPFQLFMYKHFSFWNVFPFIIVALVLNLDRTLFLIPFSVANYHYSILPFLSLQQQWQGGGDRDGGRGDSTSQYFRKCLALVHFSTPSPSFHLTEDGNQS